MYNWSLNEGALTKKSELKTLVDTTYPTGNVLRSFYLMNIKYVPVLVQFEL